MLSLHNAPLANSHARPLSIISPAHLFSQAIISRAAHVYIANPLDDTLLASRSHLPFSPAASVPTARVKWVGVKCLNAYANALVYRMPLHACNQPHKKHIKITPTQTDRQTDRQTDIRSHTLCHTCACVMVPPSPFKSPMAGPGLAEITGLFGLAGVRVATAGTFLSSLSSTCYRNTVSYAPVGKDPDPDRQKDT